MVKIRGFWGFWLVASDDFGDSFSKIKVKLFEIKLIFWMIGAFLKGGVLSKNQGNFLNSRSVALMSINFSISKTPFFDRWGFFKINMRLFLFVANFFLNIDDLYQDQAPRSTTLTFINHAFAVHFFADHIYIFD